MGRRACVHHLQPPLRGDADHRRLCSRSGGRRGAPRSKRALRIRVAAVRNLSRPRALPRSEGRPPFRSGVRNRPRESGQRTPPAPLIGAFAARASARRLYHERLRFVARLLEGEKMAPLCAEFGISRKTGYKIFDRYKACGVEAFSDRSHRAHRQANRLPAPIEATIVRLKREYPGWGAPKIREKLRQQFTGPHLPAISTVHAVLDRHGLVHHRRRRRSRAAGTELSRPTQPNALWCADYKGEFLLGNRRYCYPLTITDFASRYLLTCEALLTTQEKFAFTVFERTFKEFGLPQVIRTDNGVPFASAHAIYGLSKLAVWWLRLGK